MIYKKIGELCRSYKKGIKPVNDEVYTLFSLPAFDNNEHPEIVNGSEIKSNKLVVTNNMILFNKLNVKYRRVWNIKTISTKNNLCSTEFIPLIANDGIDQDYLYYCLISDDVTYAMHAARKGTSNSQQRIDESILFSHSIPVPDLEVQKKIASLLGSIDDKIRINKQINDNLSIYESNESTSISPDISFGRSVSRRASSLTFSSILAYNFKYRDFSKLDNGSKSSLRTGNNKLYVCKAFLLRCKTVVPLTCPRQCSLKRLSCRIPPKRNFEISFFGNTLTKSIEKTIFLYFNFVNKTSALPITSAFCVNVADYERDNSADIYIRVFMDEENSKALIMGWIDKDAFYTNPETHKLILNGKSEVPLYFVKKLKKGLPIVQIHKVLK